MKLHRRAGGASPLMSPVSNRTGFTLVELLIVVSILLIMTTITVATMNSFQNTERIRSSARQVQSSLMGARDRAIRYQEPFGVRFLVNPNASVNGNLIVDSMVYIQPVKPDTNKGGGGKKIQLERQSTNGTTANGPDVTVIRGVNVNWQLFAQQGILQQGARIKIPNDATGSWYTITYKTQGGNPLIYGADTNQPTTSILYLSSPYRGSVATYNAVTQLPIVAVAAPVTYQLELSPIVQSNQEPMRLASNVGIDMNLSSQFSTQTNYFDVMYNPRGTVHGWLSSYGIVYFYLRELDDISPAGTANDPAAQKNFPIGFKAAKPQLICTLYTQTGNVITSEVNPTDAYTNLTQWPVNGTPIAQPQVADGYADDPYAYARAGRKAGK